MISEAVKKRVAEIETKTDFNELMQSFKLSNADDKIKEEAIIYLREQYPNFDIVDKFPSKELLEEIKAGEADIDDICGY